MSALALESADVADGVVQPDGEYVFVGDAGASPASAHALLVARLDSGGLPDASFGDEGFVETRLGDDAKASTVALEPDGKIVVAGSVRSGSKTNALIARYNPDGSLDTSFGTGGTVSNLPGAATEVALQPDGKIVVAAQDPAQFCAPAFTVARYKSDGSLDASFGSGGVAAANLGTGVCMAEDSLLLQPNGKIIVAGAGSSALTIIRENGDGSLDTSFGAGGMATVGLASTYLIPGPRTALLRQPDGRLVLATTGLGGFALVRLLQDGSRDSSFGSGGIATVAHPTCCVVTRAIALQPDSKIVLAAGNLTGTPPNPGLLARFNTDGSLDSGFGTGGTSALDFGSGGVRVAALALDSMGRMVVLGGATGCAVFDEGCAFDFGAIGLGRFMPSGAPDTSFGNEGSVVASPLGRVLVVDARDSHPKAVIVQPNGSLIVAGDAYAYDTHPLAGGSGFALARYSRDGRLDPGFGDGGRVATAIATDPSFLPTTATTALRQRNGKIVVIGAGRNSRGKGQVEYALARYEPDGSLDPSFGSGGIVTTTFPAQQGNVAGAALQAGARIVVGGNVGGRAKVVRYRSDGSLDASFGRSGVVTLTGTRSVGTLQAVGLQRKGRILVAGARGLPGPFSGAMVELNADGSRNLSFGAERGVASVPVGKRGSIGGILTAAGDRPLVFGRTGTRRVAAFGYRANGKRDGQFDRRARALRGVSEMGASAVTGTIDPDGKLILGGTDHRSFVLVRLKPNGALNRAFGVGGVATSTVSGRLKALATERGRILATGDASFENANGSNRQTLAVVAAFHS